MKKMFDKSFLNILQMGIGFFLLFIAYQSCANIQQFVLESVYNYRNGTGPPIDSNSGYISAAIDNTCITAFNFIAPAIVNTVGDKWALIVGGSLYLLYVASYLYVTNYFLYTCSFLLGLGSAVTWVGQGSYFSKNSNEKTVARNSGIFWAMYQGSYCFGGLFVYFVIASGEEPDYNTCRTIITSTVISASNGTTAASEDTYLSMDTIQTIYISFVVIGSIGILVFILLRKSVVQCAAQLNSKDSEEVPTDWLSTFIRTLKLIFTLPMALFIVLFFYTGLEQSYWSGVYGTSLADTLQFPSHKTVLALNGIFLGIGQTVGGLLFMVFGKRVNRFWQHSVACIGLFSSMLCFLLVFLNISSVAPNHETCDVSYIAPNVYVALLCSFLFGFADACWNVQIFLLLGVFYAKDSAPAFGLFNLFQAAALSVAFFYTGSGHLQTQWQLLIMAIACPVATLCLTQATRIVNERLAYHK